MAKTKRGKGRSKNFVYRSNAEKKLDMASYVSGLVNPFDESAQGSKVHDANASNTFTFTSRQIHNVNVNNNGMGYVQVYPNIKAALKQVDDLDTDLPSTGILGGAASFTSTDIQSYGSLEPITQNYRIVSWGVRLQSMVSALDAKGRILIREMTNEGAAVNQNITYLTDNQSNVAHTHDMDLTIIPNHISNNYQTFIDPDLTYGTQLADNQDDPAFRSIGISLMGFEPSGTANTQVAALTLEIVYNLELIPKIGTISMKMSSLPAPHSHAVLEAVHNARTNLKLVHKSPSLWQKVKSAAGSALKAVGHYAFDRLSGGALGALENTLNSRYLAEPRRAGIFPAITNG